MPDPTAEQPATEPPATEPPPPRRLLRSRSDRVLGGVCGGIGQYFAVDPVIVRVAAVALVFFGGAGALLYLAALLLVPDESTVPGGAGPAPAPARNRGLVIVGIVLLVVVGGPLLFLPALAVGGIAVPLAILFLLCLGIAWLATGRQPAREPAALLRAFLVGLGILVGCAALFAGAFWGAGLGGDTAIAALVIAAGVALVAGAFVRPARWLILPALAVAIPAGFVAAADIDLSGGVGDKTYRPTAGAVLQPNYELGAGQMTVDLRSARLAPGDHPLNLRVGMGEAVVIVPSDVCVATRAQLGMGAVSVFDHESGGIDVDWVDETRAPAGRPRLVLDADIGVGHLDVRHTSVGPDELPGHRYYDTNDPTRGRNTGCVA